jgi:hypothetical protein
MERLSVEAACKEVVSLLSESVEEFRRMEPQTAILLLLESQFLLGEVIQHELTKLHCTPPLMPAAGESVEEECGLALLSA